MKTILLLNIVLAYLFSATFCQAQAPSSNDCDRMYYKAFSRSQGETWQNAYDTGKACVEQCHGIMKTHGMFSNMSTSNALRSDDLNRFPEHLQWLKKVLFYDPDSLYYCADAYAMMGTLTYFDSLRGDYLEAKLSVLRYQRDSAHCGHR